MSADQKDWLDHNMQSLADSRVSLAASSKRASSQTESTEATSSRAVLLVPRFSILNEPWSSFLTVATASEADSRDLEHSATANGPSFVLDRSARMS